jgi:hypothetical protein
MSRALQMSRLKAGRHDRGWPKVTLLTWTTTSDQSWRFSVQTMGKRDNWSARGGWLEIIQWVRLKAWENRPLDAPQKARRNPQQT